MGVLISKECWRVLSPFVVGVFDVCAVRPFAEMVRANAGRIVASMKDAKLRGVPMLKQHAYAMRSFCAPSYA